MSPPRCDRTSTSSSYGAWTRSSSSCSSLRSRGRTIRPPPPSTAERRRSGGPSSRMAWLLRSRAQTVAALLALAILLAIVFLPLFGGPGYEIALAAGLVLPTLAAAATALDTLRRRAEPFDA